MLVLGALIFVHHFLRLQIMELDSHKLLVGAGVAADTSNFTEFIQKNLKLYELNNDLKLDTHSAGHFIRGEVLDSITLQCTALVTFQSTHVQFIVLETSIHFTFISSLPLLYERDRIRRIYF